MGYGLTDAGEEMILRHFYRENVTKPASVDLGLYYEPTDALGDAEIDPATDVTTEPAGASYARVAKTFGTTDFDTLTKVNGNYRVLMSDTAFDLSDSNTTDDGGTDVDSWFMTANFTSVEAGNVLGDYIILRGSLGQVVDVSTIAGNYTLADAGHAMD